MYFNLHSQSAPPNYSPEPREEPQATTPTTSTRATYLGTSWFNLKAARPTNVEVEVMTATLAACNWGHDLDKWLAEAEIDAPRMSKLGDEWAPLPNSTVYSSKGKVLAPLELKLSPTTTWPRRAVMARSRRSCRHSAGAVSSSRSHRSIATTRLFSSQGSTGSKVLLVMAAALPHRATSRPYRLSSSSFAPSAARSARPSPPAGSTSLTRSR